MTKRTLCKIEKVRKGLIKEISKQAINLNKKNLHYKGIIPLDFSYDDVCKYCPSLENYQYINETYATQIEDLNKAIKRKNRAATCWKIGGITVSIGLVLFLLLK